MARVPISGVTLSMTLLRLHVTVPVWTVTKRRECVLQSPGLDPGEDGHGGDHAARLVGEESDRD